MVKLLCIQSQINNTAQIYLLRINPDPNLNQNYKITKNMLKSGLKRMVKRYRRE